VIGFRLWTLDNAPNTVRWVQQVSQSSSSSTFVNELVG
jgi:hypothetical protein